MGLLAGLAAMGVPSERTCAPVRAAIFPSWPCGFELPTSATKRCMPEPRPKNLLDGLTATTTVLLAENPGATGVPGAKP